MKRSCVILAAGLGKRMRSSLAKVLHPVLDRPMLLYPVALALDLGCRPVVVVAGHQEPAVRALLQSRFGARVRVARQWPPRGTGHALLSALGSLPRRGSLLVLCGDVPLLTADEVRRLRRGARGAAVAFLSARVSDPSGYGRVVRDDRGEVLRIVEHADADEHERRIDEINTGVYLLDLAFARRAVAGLTTRNAQREFYLTDLVVEAREQGRGVRAIAAADPGAVLGINHRAELAQAEERLSARLALSLSRRGVTIHQSHTTRLCAGLRAGRDSEILPGCQFYGTVRLGRGCRIGPYAVLRDCAVGDGATVGPFCVLEECAVGKDARVGPFSRLRPGAVLGPEAHVGNFVEIKKSRLGRGTKANHLAYLGDATIGRGVNVGAGTITCNYDGQNKHPTFIGDGAFIGSDTQLVAPVRIGKNAVVGAGTTVTRDVPPEALAVSRTPQTHVPGYARRRRRRAEAQKGRS